MEDIPSEEEWKNIAVQFYNYATNLCLYKFVRSPSPAPPASDPLFMPTVNIVRFLSEGMKVLSFDEVFADEEAMNHLMSFAVGLYLPEDEDE